VYNSDDGVESNRPCLKKPRDAHAMDDKKERIRAGKGKATKRNLNRLQSNH